MRALFVPFTDKWRPIDDRWLSCVVSDPTSTRLLSDNVKQQQEDQVSSSTGKQKTAYIHIYCNTMSPSISSSIKALLGLAVVALPISAFAPQPLSKASSPSTWELREVIRGEDVDAETMDLGEGGVRLAQESAIKITGDVKHKPGNAVARPMELLRYNNLKQIEDSNINDVFGKIGSKILCTGQGIELYKDPGETLETSVSLAPMEAVKDAVKAAASAMECEQLVFNFLGGDSLMIGEVLDATNELVVMLDIATSAKISFNSLCHNSVPSGTCSLAVISVGSSSEEGDFSGVAAKSIAAGEIYMLDGTWWTVEDSELNTAAA
jgi:hypothetical protein